MTILRRARGPVLAAACLLAPLAALGAGDLHAVISQTSEWVDGSRKTTATTEIWMAGDRESRSDGRSVIITRRDLNTVWVLDPRTRTYEERPLGEQPDQAAAGRTGLHNEGFEYEPRFDWVVQPGGETRILLGQTCRRYVLEGDADYASLRIEIWAADGLGLETGRYPGLKAHFLSRTIAPLLDEVEILRDLWILAESARLEPAISSGRLEDTAVLTCEETDPPAGIYEIPEGFTRRARSPER